ncbi:MAG: hypothetical protein KGJ06_06645 [Pseudomonadota bacterium]|nr:hypothetical protein [Pseudomonadota bacterium]
MNPTDQSMDDYLDAAAKIRTGEYFREARAMYDIHVHDPMAERYVHIMLAALSFLAFLIAMTAMQSLYPLQSSVPFIVSTNNINDDLPRIHTLVQRKGESANEALLEFLGKNYVQLREEYDIDTFGRNISGVRSQSSPEAFKEFQQAIDPHNPASPVAMYQRHSKRKIEVVSVKAIPDRSEMEVAYDADVEEAGVIKKSSWSADIAFQYEGIALDEKSDKVKPFHFVVTQYRTRRL